MKNVTIYDFPQAICKNLYFKSIWNLLHRSWEWIAKSLNFFIGSFINLFYNVKFAIEMYRVSYLSHIYFSFFFLITNLKKD